MTDSRAGGAAPPEPEFQTAAQALISVQNVALLARMAGRHQESADLEFCVKTVRATLDQAEFEIARLREENARIREAAALKRNFLLNKGKTPTYIGEWVAVPRDDFAALRALLAPSVSPSVPKEEDKP